MTDDHLSPQQQFIVDLYPAARRISQQTGMSWELILAQAAQETRWGASVLPGTHNIFNIKASGDWHGPAKTFTVPEFEHGRKVFKAEPFRVYASTDEALRDRVAFLRDNPRYAKAGLFAEGTRGDLASEARALQRAGYATDPAYADHLIGVFNGPTMQAAVARAQEHEREGHGASQRAEHPSPRMLPAHGADNAAILREAELHFIVPGNKYEYGRSDSQSRNREGNGRTDSSRFELDGDGDGLKGVDCSSFVWRALKNAGCDVPPNTPRQPFTTQTLFTGDRFTSFARSHFDVVPAYDAKALKGGLEVGDIICFVRRGRAGQHVAIFSGYDAHGVPHFLGSQTGRGPSSSSAEPGTYWNGDNFEIVGALRAKPEFHVRAPLHGETAPAARTHPAVPAARAPHGRGVALETQSADVTLSVGDQGTDVSVLQQRLFELGYRTESGKPLGVDGTFGSDTLFALKQFQREHGLEGKGVAGPRTEAALRQAEATLMSDPSHPQYKLFVQALEKVKDAERARGMAPGPHSAHVAGVLVVEAVRKGLTRIDHVAISETGRLAWAIEDRPAGKESGLGRTDGVSLSQAHAQPLRESTEQAHQVAVNVRAQHDEPPARTPQPQPAMAR